MRSITVIPALLATLQLLSGTAHAAGDWTWPLRGPVLTRYLNGDDPYAAGQHRGVDIGAPVGTRVVAAAAGRVTFAGVVGSSGLTVAERTADGRFDLSYLHLSGAAVRAGDSLEAGAPVGAVGTSGVRSVDAPHLHFGVREAGRRSAYRDPLDFLAPPPAPDAPRPEPSPLPVGDPVAADPRPAVTAAAAGAPAPVASPAPGPVAAGLGAAPPLIAPSGAPEGATAGGARGSSLHGRSTGPALGPGAHRSGVLHGAHRTASAGRAPTPASSPHHTAASRPSRGPAAGRVTAPAGKRSGAAVHRSGGGIDLGWLAACVGLVVAATLLAHPQQASRLARRGRSGVGALVGPRTSTALGAGHGLRRRGVRQ